MQYNREDNLALELVGSGLGNVISHLAPRRRYQGMGTWTWQMRREGRLETGRGEYILSSDRDTIFKEGVRESILHTYHWMVLAVL